MYIHDFHSKFAAPGEEGCLFTALRNLSQVDNTLMEEDTLAIRLDWLPWQSGDTGMASPVSPRA